MKNSLAQLFNTLDPSKDGASVKYQHYLDIYENFLHYYKANVIPIKLLEIGIEKGGSLSLWSKYFSSDSKIVGIDIKQGCKANQRGNIHVEIGDQKDQAFLSKVIDLHGPFDVIIDDGGHHTEEHIASFKHLFLNGLNPHGVYFIEDLHTCYMPEFNGGVNNYTFINFIQNLLHNCTHNHDPEFNNLVNSVHVFNSIIAVTKTNSGKNKIKSPGFDAVPYPI